MQLPENRFKRAIATGRRQLGLWSTFSSSYTVEIVAGAGFDWILLDMEHSPTDVENLILQLQAIAAYPSHPVVRLPDDSPTIIKRVLDAGVQTLLVPHVSTVEEARRVVSATRYPPGGIRGVGGTTRATRFGRVRDYVKSAHQELCVIIMVEDQQGLDNIEALCAVDGIDGVFIGPGDLSVAIGYPGDSGNLALLQIIEDAIRRIAGTGRAAGYMSTIEADAKRMLAAGAVFCGIGMDAHILVRGAEALLKRFA